MMRCALYARVSTINGQTTANQVRELEQFIAARGWTLASSHCRVKIELTLQHQG